MPYKTVALKLLIKENHTVLLVNEPKDCVSILGELPPNVTVWRRPTESADLIQVFVTTRKELETKLENLKSLIKPKGIIVGNLPQRNIKNQSGHI